jgi:hemoglobin-like flavoprotein
MKLVLAIVLLGYAVYTCSAECDILERYKIKHQWAEAFGTGHNRVTFGLHFWLKFFRDHPDSRALFKRVNSDNPYSHEFEAHSQRVLSGLEGTISLLDDDDAIAAHLVHLHGQHQERNIPPENFTHFRDTLLDILGDILGTSLDHEAWEHCIDHITAGIK